MEHGTPAFTLIELLVVVSIIVVLLALLTPALDKAIYQAELAVCASNLDAAAQGLVIYTGDHKRRYPHRAGVVPGSDWQHAKFFDAAHRDQVAVDPYLDINGVYNDPLAKPVDYENAQPTSHAYTPYALWYGYQFANEKGMFRFGDRWTWSNSETQRNEKHDLLISDLDAVGDGSQAWGSHPDRDGVLQPFTRQDEDQQVAVPGGGGAMVAFPVNKMVSTLWQSRVTVSDRGAVDLNFAHEDGSVDRYVDVEWEDLLPGNATERLRSVDWNATTRYWPGLRITVPVTE